MVIIILDLTLGDAHIVPIDDVVSRDNGERHGNKLHQLAGPCIICLDSWRS